MEGGLGSGFPIEKAAKKPISIGLTLMKNALNGDGQRKREQILVLRKNRRGNSNAIYMMAPRRRRVNVRAG